MPPSWKGKKIQHLLPPGWIRSKGVELDKGSNTRDLDKDTTSGIAQGAQNKRIELGKGSNTQDLDKDVAKGVTHGGQTR